MAEVWQVPIVILNKQRLVVDLGGGHFVDLVGLEDKINIKTPVEPELRYPDIKDRYPAQFDSNSEIYGYIRNRKVTCEIPVEKIYGRGGRQSKVRRSRRLHRRTTRRTRR